MIEIILLFFITKEINRLAIQKGLKPFAWKVRVIVFWIIFEITGITAGLLLFGKNNIIALAFLGLICAFGAFLLLREILLQKPDKPSGENISRVGVDDLRP